MYQIDKFKLRVNLFIEFFSSFPFLSFAFFFPIFCFHVKLSFATSHFQKSKIGTCPHLGNEIGRMGPARLIWEMKKLKKQLPDGDSLD